MGDVTQFSGLTRGRVLVETVLEGAAQEDFADVLVLGIAANGELVALASSSDDGVNVLMCERFKFKLLSGDYHVE